MGAVRYWNYLNDRDLAEVLAKDLAELMPEHRFEVLENDRKHS